MTTPIQSGLANELNAIPLLAKCSALIFAELALISNDFRWLSAQREPISGLQSLFMSPVVSVNMPLAWNQTRRKDSARSGATAMSKSRKLPANHARPLNVALEYNPRTRHWYTQAGLPGGPQARRELLAPGFTTTPDHNLVYHGGKTIQNLAFTNFYVGGTQSWNHADVQNIDRALAAAMCDTHLNNVVMQYFNNQPITSTFSPSTILDDAKPTVFSQGDVEQLIKQIYSPGQMKGYDLSMTVFNFMLPSGTVLNTDTTPTRSSRHRPAQIKEQDTSLQGLGGYHGSVHLASGDTIYYAIAVYSEALPDGSQNGIVAFEEPWKNIVATFYHELNEARTDADVEDAIKAGDDPKATSFLGWMSEQGEEIGDYPVFEADSTLSEVMQEVPLTDGSGSVPVQFLYSNAVNGPEGPISEPHLIGTQAPGQTA